MSDLTLVIGGDLHVQRDRPESAFEQIAPVLHQADVLFGNLEGIPSDVGDENQKKTTGKFKSDASMMAAYTYAGFHAVGLSNNHSMDFGAPALLRCMELLDQAGIVHTGGGHDVAEARRPAHVQRDGTRFAFLSYSTVFIPEYAATAARPGIATIRVKTTYEAPPRLVEAPGAPPIIRTDVEPQDIEAMLAAVKEARSSADVVVLSCHWGLSPAAGGAAAVVGYETVLAHAAIDAGVDLVVGHHPHMLEAVEVYKGKCIFYSLGNFAFDFFAGREFGLERNSFGLIRAVVRDRSLREVTFLPMRIPNDTATPVMQDTKEGGDIVDRLLQLSAPYGTQFTIGPQGVTVETAVPAGVA